MSLKQRLRNCVYLATLVSGSVLLSISTHAQDEQQYVTDILHVPLRSGEGNEYRIINKGIRSGTPLTILEAGSSEEWVKVRTPQGVEGWIRSQYLQENETASRVAAKMESQLKRANEENARLQQEVSNLKKQAQTLQQTSDSAQSAEREMAEELQNIKTLSAGAIDLEKRYTELLERQQLLQTQNDVLIAENENIKGDTSVKFMLYGAGLIIIGILTALIVPALTVKKRHSEWR
ncbi:TIGR04211 family SH3 domain-containing protein [Teredinibacter turnerae]|uniref:TIGR04211 family SH3 domain-containing protein n=1 Tax=Teredinibacter turnerae TaxID=2426 RepID=UPI0005A17561|nr:TIGR04211 family SH3 domain-containing protein [Teredinibacter turnerae]